VADGFGEKFFEPLDFYGAGDAHERFAGDSALILPGV
jgi:hypothetical protein